VPVAVRSAALLDARSTGIDAQRTSAQVPTLERRALGGMLLDVRDPALLRFSLSFWLEGACRGKE
jgi:hypothetical protein